MIKDADGCSSAAIEICLHTMQLKQILIFFMMWAQA